jgi:hypothetical protein
MSISRPSYNAETGMPLTPTRLRAQPSNDLRIAFNQFLTLPAREEFARKRLVIPLFSRSEVALDLGDGGAVTGVDTLKDASYNEMIHTVHRQVFPLKKDIAKPRFMDAGLELGGFSIKFETLSDRKSIVGLPLFDQNFAGSVELYTRIPNAMLLGRSALDDAYRTLQMKMDSNVEESAPIGMHVRDMTLLHRYPKLNARLNR